MPSGYLSRDEYLALASKQSPLEPAMRPAAYDAFEEYLKKKKKNGLYDVCDLAPLPALPPWQPCERARHPRDACFWIGLPPQDAAAAPLAAP